MSAPSSKQLCTIHGRGLDPWGICWDCQNIVDRIARERLAKWPADNATAALPGLPPHVAAVADAFETELRVSICSDVPDKVAEAAKAIADIILDPPAQTGDVMVTVTQHRPADETAAPRKPEVKCIGPECIYHGSYHAICMLAGWIPENGDGKHA